MIFIVTFLFIIFFILLIIPLVKHINSVDEETMINTTNTEDDVVLGGTRFVGTLKRSWHGKQPFIVDPLEQNRVYLNTSDDIYEDSAGKWWRIV